MKTYAIGDIHGYLKPLKQCLARSGFDFENDRLICLGDVADRGPETYECFELLLSIKNLVYILGNHDSWLLKFFNTPNEFVDLEWFHNWQMFGGKETMASYQKNKMQYKKHYQLLDNAHLFFLDESNRLFVHGGFRVGTYLDAQNEADFCWNRNLWQTARFAEENISYQLNMEKPAYDNAIFIGHSSTHLDYLDLQPINFANVWNLDQGAGHGYKLTIMEVENFNYWQSDLVSKLYKP